MNTLLFYYIVDFISVMFMGITSKLKKLKMKETNEYLKNKKDFPIFIFFLFSLLVPFVVLILRDTSVGIDYKAYTDLYLRYVNDRVLETDSSWVGVGYSTLMKGFTYLFADNYLLFFGMIGFVTLYLFFKTIYNESERPTLSLLFLFMSFLYYEMFNQSRQMLAIGITFYALKYIKKRNFKKFVIAILIASSIHTSAIVMIPFYWISNINIPKKRNYLYILIPIVVFVAYQFVENLLLKTRYGQIYLTNSYYNYINGSSIFNTALRIIMFAFCFFASGKQKYTDKNTRILLNLCFVCVVFQILTLKSYVFGRITTYFFVYFFILIANVLSNIRISKEQSNLVYLLIFATSVAYHYIYFITKGKEIGVDVYKFLNL